MKTWRFSLGVGLLLIGGLLLAAPFSGLDDAAALAAVDQAGPLRATSYLSKTVLLLSPDDSLSDLETALAAFSDLSVTRFPKTSLPGLSAGDLVPYDVVMTINNTQWSPGGVEPSQVGDALADYIDAGGKVIANAYAYDPGDWGLAGRFVDEQYGPFTQATTDFLGESALGTVHEPSHPIMVGVASITNTYPWQDPGLAPGATRIADWDDGALFLAANSDVVALNLVPTNNVGSAGWTGDLPTLYHNAVLWLAWKSRLYLPLAIKNAG
jgi:hypothetical protein